MDSSGARLNRLLLKAIEQNINNEEAASGIVHDTKSRVNDLESQYHQARADLTIAQEEQNGVITRLQQDRTTLTASFHKDQEQDLSKASEILRRLGYDVAKPASALHGDAAASSSASAIAPTGRASVVELTTALSGHASVRASPAANLPPRPPAATSSGSLPAYVDDSEQEPVHDPKRRKNGPLQTYVARPQTEFRPSSTSGVSLSTTQNAVSGIHRDSAPNLPATNAYFAAHPSLTPTYSSGYQGAVQHHPRKSFPATAPQPSGYPTPTTAHNNAMSSAPSESRQTGYMIAKTAKPSLTSLTPHPSHDHFLEHCPVIIYNAEAGEWVEVRYPVCGVNTNIVHKKFSKAILGMQNHCSRTRAELGVARENALTICKFRVVPKEEVEAIIAGGYGNAVCRIGEATSATPTDSMNEIGSSA